MNNFLLKEIINSDILSEIIKIGFQENYAPFVVDKFSGKNIKIFNLTCAQANILKQTALSVGSDCATHKDVITGKIEFSDVILTGSVYQLKQIAKKLEHQPFKLKFLGEELENLLSVQKSGSTKIMGILNITEDSFSDGGMFNDFNSATEHLKQLIQDGADIIDIGAESTKPYSEPVCPDAQLEKLIPILQFINENEIDVKVSIDTRSSIVAKECLKYGVKYINDVSGMDYDLEIGKVVATSNAKIILQHSLSTPDTMQNSPEYDWLMDDIYINLSKKVKCALSQGISKENILIDPGIGFGKTREHNFEIIRRIEELNGLNCPVVLGLSRKSLLNMPSSSNDEKDIFTLALNSLAIERKVDIIRVHNVKLHKKYMDIKVY